MDNSQQDKPKFKRFCLNAIFIMFAILLIGGGYWSHLWWK